MAFESLLTFQEILNATGGKRIGFACESHSFFFDSVAIDSRNVKKKSLFVPLIGKNEDGHKYIGAALEAGASVVFVTLTVYEKSVRVYEDLAAKNLDATFIAVKNNLHALQDVARAYVEKFPRLLKIGITGSSGKTTTKEILSLLLAQKFAVVSTQGNLNSETGLPLSVFEIRPQHEVAVFELGMNRKDEIAETACVLKPNYAIITNIGSAHIGILQSRKNIAAEKKKIFDYIKEDGAAFVLDTCDFADFLCDGVKGKVVRFGVRTQKNFGVRFIEDCGLLGTKFSVDGIETCLKIPGAHNYENAISCIALAKELGLGANEIVRGFEDVCAQKGRCRVLEILTKKNSCGACAKITVFDDCYNANPDSMQKALKFCGGTKCAGKKIFVLADMKELGKNAKSAHTKIGIFCAKTNPKGVVFFTGPLMKNAFCAAKKAGFKNAKYFSSSQGDGAKKIAGAILDVAKDGDFLFLKGSASMGLLSVLCEICSEEDFEKL